ncbi:MAG: glycosyltransferase family 2 protein [Pseudomonadota bacterium]
MPRLSVIVVNYNSAGRLARCLGHLARQTFADFETIVVDNASADDSIAQAKAISPSATYIMSEKNLGFAAANNLAAKSAAGEALVFLNPDAYAEAEWLAELVAASERYPWADAFGSTQVNAADPSKIDGAGDVFHILGVAYRGHFGWPIEELPSEGECFSVCAAAAMYRKRAFDALGGFDERFFCYGEDVDLGFRLRLVGGRAVQVRKARVAHEGSGVTGRHSDFTVYYGHRNRIWAAYKNLPAVLYWAGLPFRLALDVALLVRAIAGGYAAPYLKALRDGYFRAGLLREDRNRIQDGRMIGAGALSSQLTWSLLKLLARAADIRPI